MMPISIAQPAPSNQRLRWCRPNRPTRHRPDGMIHLILDRRVESRKLFRRKLRFQGMGAEGPEAHGQGGEQAAEDDKK